MDEQKRFQKITLNSDDYKWIEKAAKTTKIIGTGVAAVGVFLGGATIKTKYFNHDKKPDVEEQEEEQEEE